MKVIPISAVHLPSQAPVQPLHLPAGATLSDQFGRGLRDLRISITDRCNFRCVYCMPREVFGDDYAFLPRTALLSFEEITRLARIFASRGVQKIRLTGGEPLLRKGVEKLVAMLAEIPGLELTLTTNGVLLPKLAGPLRRAGLHRLTVSLDSLDDPVFRRMNDANVPVADVLRGIDVADAAGFAPIKINMVVQRGMNDDGIVAMARQFRGTGHIVRFIEFMDVGTSNGWNLQEVVPSQEVVDRISAEFPLVSLEPGYTGEVAERWAYADGHGEIGVISSVTQAFCGTCTRLRLSTEGQLFTCLFAEQGHDLRSVLRGGGSDEELDARIAGVWAARTDRYSALRTAQTSELRRKIEMSYIGG
ncbi:MAG: GTP 3',8-cyclase MoaA [Zoogloeaceae bacterium]|nr:GTP 3',8-cyclase MoaA [Zoogloeaceae bacterium]